MFNPSELQEHFNSLDESLIESASLESGLVTELASELSELTPPVFGAALESRLSASIDSAESESTDHGFGISSMDSEDSYEPIATVSDQNSDIFNISVSGQNAGDKLSLDLGQSFGSTESELSVSQNSLSQHYGSFNNLNAFSSYASASSQIPFAPAVGVWRSNNDRVNTLLGGTKWYANTISYSFFDYGSSGVNYSEGWIYEASDAVKNNVRSILEYYIEPYINVNFVEVADRGNSFGQLRYSMADLGVANNGQPYYAHAHLPGSTGTHNDGDVHLSRLYDRLGDTMGFQWGPRSHGFMTLMHETLHALGLKHPGNYNFGGGGAPKPYLPPGEDNTYYTVMSYNAAFKAPTLRSYDVMALRYLYGAKNRYGARSYYAGNTTYTFDTASGSADGSQPDGCGHDTHIGESGNDPLVGYAGGTEYDVLTGGTGTDTFVLGNSSSALVQGDDYAKITDFDSKDDYIQVKGTSSQYSLQSGNWFGDSALDTAISFGNDVIGVVQDSTNISLARNFAFV